MKITEVSEQKNNPLRVNVFIDGAYSFSFDAAEAVLKGLKEGRELSEKEIKNLLMDSEFSKARDYALGILSRKNITSKLLEDKLSEKGYNEIIIGEVINELSSLGYIDDEAYAQMFFEYCLEKMWGKKKIHYEMLLKGIPENLAEEILSSYNIEEAICNISAFITERYTADDLKDAKTKAKITRHFASRGFGFSEISEAIARAIKEISDE